MKKIQISLAALLLTVSVAMAQPDVRKQPLRQHHQKEMAFKDLNLSEDQKAKMKAINDDFRSKMQALKSNENQTVKQQRDGREALVKQHKAQVENILTTEQKTKLTSLKADAQKRHQEMASKHLDKMKAELNLSDDQVAKLKSTQQATHDKMKAIHDNASLDRTAKMQQMKAIRKDMKGNLDKILTPEQKAKWQGMKKDHMNRGGHRKFHEKKMPAPAAV